MYKYQSSQIQQFNYHLLICIFSARYDLDTGLFDGLKFSVSVTVSNVAFDGRDMCVSSGSTTTRCYQLLNRNIYDIPVSHKAALIEDSRILSREMNQLLSEHLRGHYFKRCYSGTEDGFSASTFHQRCDNMGPSVVVGRLPNGRIIGGFAPMSWTSSTAYQRAQDAFLFKFENNQFFRTNEMVSTPQNAVYHRSNYCPTFGTYISNMFSLFCFFV